MTGDDKPWHGLTLSHQVMQPNYQWSKIVREMWPMLLTIHIQSHCITLWKESVVNIAIESGILAIYVKFKHLNNHFSLKSFWYPSLQLSKVKGCHQCHGPSTALQVFFANMNQDATFNHCITPAVDITITRLQHSKLYSSPAATSISSKETLVTCSFSDWSHLIETWEQSSQSVSWPVDRSLNLLHGAESDTEPLCNDLLVYSCTFSCCILVLVYTSHKCVVVFVLIPSSLWETWACAPISCAI